MEFKATQQVSVIMSSHLVADLGRVCDYLIVLDPPPRDLRSACSEVGVF